MHALDARAIEHAVPGLAELALGVCACTHPPRPEPFDIVLHGGKAAHQVLSGAVVLGCLLSEFLVDAFLRFDAALILGRADWGSAIRRSRNAVIPPVFE